MAIRLDVPLLLAVAACQAGVVFLPFFLLEDLIRVALAALSEDPLKAWHPSSFMIRAMILVCESAEGVPEARMVEATTL